MNTHFVKVMNTQNKQSECRTPLFRMKPEDPWMQEPTCKACAHERCDGWRSPFLPRPIGRVVQQPFSGPEINVSESFSRPAIFIQRIQTDQKLEDPLDFHAPAFRPKCTPLSLKTWLLHATDVKPGNHVHSRQYHWMLITAPPFEFAIS
jgi:hypothetical protein